MSTIKSFDPETLETRDLHKLLLSHLQVLLTLKEMSTLVHLVILMSLVLILQF